FWSRSSLALGAGCCAHAGAAVPIPAHSARAAVMSPLRLTRSPGCYPTSDGSGERGERAVGVEERQLSLVVKGLARLAVAGVEEVLVGRGRAVEAAAAG